MYRMRTRVEALSEGAAELSPIFLLLLLLLLLSAITVIALKGRREEQSLPVKKTRWLTK